MNPGNFESEAPLIPRHPSDTSPLQTNGFQNLLTSNDFLTQITENIEQACWIQNTETNDIVYVSPAFQTIWHFTEEELIANPSILIESIHPEDRVQVLAAWSQHSQKTYHQEYRILRPDGVTRWISARSFILRNQTDDINYLVSITQDITDQKQVEFALRKTIDRTREQFNLSHKMSLSRKNETVLKTLMSAKELRAAEQAILFNFDHRKDEPQANEIIGTWCSDDARTAWLNETSMDEEFLLEELFQINRMTFLSNPQTNSQLSLSLRDFLTKHQIETLAIFPLITSGIKRGCLLITFKKKHKIDLTNMRQLKVLVDQAAITLYNLKLLETEEESRHEAEHANEIKTEFLAMISHELRTPLTSIIGFTTTLLAEDVNWEAEEQHDFIQTIQHEANRLQGLIDHLLDLSRLEAGMLPIHMLPHSLNEIIEDVMPQLDILTKNHTLTMEIPLDLPCINADAQRIGQVLVNLVHNASLYAPHKTEINLTAGAHGNFVQVNVIDRGLGIPVQEHVKIFKAFQRGATSENEKRKGAGLGLAICKGLVEAHGGRIWINKKNIPGTTISFTIPQCS
jgi:PAS domain S-box-containing protein